MKDKDKTKEQLVVELAEMRQQITNMQQGHVLASPTRASSRTLEATETKLLSTQAEERQRLVIQVLELLNQSDEETDKIRDLLSLIKEATGFEAVGIRLRKNEDFPYYQTRGFPAHFVKAESSLCARNQAGELIRDAEGRPYLECMCGNVIRGRTDPGLPFFTPSGSFWTNNSTELLISTTEQDRQAHLRNRCPAEGYESMALIPLRSDDEIIGLLQLNDHRKGTFTSEIINFFEGIGASIGIALARKQMEEALRESECFLALLNDITRAALETPDLPTMLQTFADRADELFGADGCYLTLWDETTQTTIPATVHGEWCKAHPAVRIEPGETTMTASVLRAGRPLVVEDMFDTPYLSQRIAELFPERSLLGLPLIAGDQKLGAALIAFNELHHFTSDEIARAEQAAGQIALAMAKARLLEETQARWREAETLQQAGATITATLSLDERLERILVQLEQVVPYDSASVQLLKDDRLEIMGGRGFSELEAVIGLTFPVPGNNPNTAVVEGRKPVLLPDTRVAYPPFSQPPHDHIHSWMGVPLLVHDRVIGILAVDSVERGHFNQDHIRLIIPFANQVAVAIENARLYEETERLKVFNENIVQGVAEAILIVGAEGMLTFANPAAEALLGYTQEELIGLHWNALVPEDELEKVEQEMAKRLQGNESRYETALLNKAGQVIPIIVSLRPMFEGGKFVGALAAWTDITERMRTEKALRVALVKTEALYHVARSLVAYESLRELLQTVTDAVAEALPADRVTLIIGDLERRQVMHFVRGGPGSSHTVSVSCDELMDGLSGWVLRGSPPRPALSPKGEPDLRESPEVQRRRAETNCGAIIVVPVRYRDKTLGTMTAINRPDERDFVQEDVELMMTMAHQAAIAINNARLVETLRQYTAELETRNEELDAYAHTVAHDLKNPLARIVGFAEVLEEDYASLQDEELRYYLHTMAQDGRKMSNITDELLLLASVRKMEDMELESLDMAGIVTEAQGRLSHLIEEYQAEIILPDAWTAVLGYGPWVEEVWVNYLSNALKYGGEPPRVELGGEEQADGTVRFWVRDNGPGLTPEEQGRLFKSFERLDRVRARGHGLGLSIVRRIVEKLDGEVGVESEMGQGSVFWFTLWRE